MPSPADRIGPYTLAEKIGQGGMGEVYRATDTNLKRDVAIKLLPEAFTRDPERLARFQREAEVLAQLHHPNIASIFGIEEAGGVRALVMELVEGPTLAERLAHGRLSIDEALEIARQIAVALGEAHAKGIVHRDLKPGNVKLAPDKRVKVLDFGLAKALDPAGDRSGSGPDTLAHSPTLTASTQLGVILGTAAYMAPEQARGEPVDKRADVWAFGCVLFEMLTGRTTFRENTVSDTLASVLKIEPDWSLLPADVPQNLRRLLTRCLRKDPGQRLHDIADARIEIEETLATPADRRVMAAAEGARRGLSPIVTALLVVASLAIGLLAGLRWGPAEPGREVRRFFLPVEADDPLKRILTVALSPDGHQILYDVDDKLWIHDLRLGTTHAVPGTEGGDFPFWSPDGEQIGFCKDGSMWRVPVGGGPPTRIIDEAPPYYPPTWGEDGIIVYSVLEQIRQVPARGGEAVVVLERDVAVEQHFHAVVHLPGGRGLLLVPHLENNKYNTIELVTENERRVLLSVEGSNVGVPSYSPTGHLLFDREEGVTGLWAVPFSLSKLEVTGKAFLVAAEGTNGVVASDGSLIYRSARASGHVELVWFDDRGQILGPLGEPQSDMSGPALSPDGTRVAVSGAEGEEWDIWVHDENGLKERITFDQGREEMPRWSRDGERIFFFHPEAGPDPSIYSIDTAGGGQRDLLTAGNDFWLTPDESLMVMRRTTEETKGDLWSLPLAGDADPVLVLGTDADEGLPALSPNGRYLAYVSGDHVFIRSFPSGDETWQVSEKQGWRNYWSPAGDRLYYLFYDKLMEVRVSTDPVLRLGTPRLLLDSQESSIHLWRGIDITKDGKRFVGIREVAVDQAERAPDGIHVVMNWHAELE